MCLLGIEILCLVDVNYIDQCENGFKCIVLLSLMYRIDGIHAS